MIHFIDVNGGNYRDACRLQVAEDQRRFLSPATGILARAYAYRETGGRAQIICDDGEMVGLLMTRRLPELDSYDLDQFFIDHRFQGRGRGRATLELLLEQLRTEDLHPTVTLCYIEGDEVARHLYESCGFTHTGQADGNEILMSRPLRP